MNPDHAQATPPVAAVDDPAADPALRALLAEARAERPFSDADLARFSKRFGAMVGLELVAAAPLLHAPPSPSGLETLGQASAPGSAAQLAGAKVAGAKLVGGSLAAKLAAASLAVGATLWFARSAPPAAAPAPMLDTVEAAGPALQAPAPSALGPAPVPAIEALPVPAPETVRKRAARPSPVRPSAPRAAQAEAPVPDELALIRDAQALRAEPGRALAVLAEHRKHYPDGMLAQEREVLSVEALVAAGRRSDAVARARAFVAAHPSSVHVARLRTLLGASLAE